MFPTQPSRDADSRQAESRPNYDQHIVDSIFKASTMEALRSRWYPKVPPPMHTRKQREESCLGCKYSLDPDRSTALPDEARGRWQDSKRFFERRLITKSTVLQTQVMDDFLRSSLQSQPRQAKLKGEEMDAVRDDLWSVLSARQAAQRRKLTLDIEGRHISRQTAYIRSNVPGADLRSEPESNLTKYMDTSKLPLSLVPSRAAVKANLVAHGSNVPRQLTMQKATDNTEVLQASGLL